MVLLSPHFQTQNPSADVCAGVIVVAAEADGVDPGQTTRVRGRPGGGAGRGQRR